MIRTYNMRLKTTQNQDDTLGRLLAQLCELYNMALQQRRDAYRHGKTVTRYDQQRQLTELRNEVQEYAEFPAIIQRDPLRRLDLAFKSFFRRCKLGDAPGFPRFRSRARYDSFDVDKQNFRLANGFVRITKLGSFRIKTRCRLRGTPLTLRVKRLGNHWVASIVMDVGLTQRKVVVQRATGIDLGLASLVTLGDGTKIPNPRWVRTEEDRLAQANRSLSRKKRGSKNRVKAREQLRRVYQRIAGLRSSYLNGIARRLLVEYDLIAYEDLRVKNLVRARLGKSILDAAWGQLIWKLTYKAEEAGKWVIPVNPRGTSQKCSGCGVVVSKQLGDRRHECAACGLSLDRDHNAALNILALGESAALKAESALA